MLTAVKLRDQWSALERRLPGDWESVALRIRPEQPNELSAAASVLAPMGVGLTGGELTLTVRRAGGSAGPEAARRLFSRLDERRVWCLLEQERVDVVDEAPPGLAPIEAPDADGSVAQSWDAMLAGLPSDWSDLLCSLELDSSALLARAALLCAPLNPARDRARAGFTFRSARRSGYGVSPAVARRCFERLDDDGIQARVGVLRLLSDADNVATQGAVWYVGGKAL
jgi:hypothetical protein